MASNFKRLTSRAVGTGLTAVGAYTVAAGVQTTVIGLTVANVSASPITVDVAHHDGTNITYIVKNAPVAVGGSLVAVGGDQKVVLLAGDSIRVVSSASTSADVLMSVLEVS